MTAVGFEPRDRGTVFVLRELGAGAAGGRASVAKERGEVSVPETARAGTTIAGNRVSAACLDAVEPGVARVLPKLAHGVQAEHVDRCLEFMHIIYQSCTQRCMRAQRAPTFRNGTLHSHPGRYGKLPLPCPGSSHRGVLVAQEGRFRGSHRGHACHRRHRRSCRAPEHTGPGFGGSRRLSNVGERGRGRLFCCFCHGRNNAEQREETELHSRTAVAPVAGLDVSAKPRQPGQERKPRQPQPKFAAKGAARFFLGWRDGERWNGGCHGTFGGS